MTTYKMLRICSQLPRFYVTVLLIAFAGGCNCCSRSPRVNRNDEQPKTLIASRETQAVKVVEGWYRSHGYNVPQRIVVHEIRDNRCILTAGQEHIESGFEVDLTEMKVVKFTAGD